MAERFATSMIKASDLPASVTHAFLDALEAWGLLEHELFMTWQLLMRSTDLEAAWQEFTTKSTGQQRESTLRLVRADLEQRDTQAAMPEVYGRLEAVTDIRNRLVHGRWHAIHEAGGEVVEYIRIYDARGVWARPNDTNEEQAMLGRSRFYEADLREAECQFRAAARDLSHARADLIGGYRV
jgi:hypothetical protein